MTPTAQHYVGVAAFLMASGAVMLWARQASPTRQRAIEIAAGILGIAISAMVTIWWLQPSRFSMAVALPLQMCDLVGMIAPAAMLTRTRWVRTLLHFWGLGLCSQWMFTPVTATGAETAAFWMSFLLHVSILFSAFWDFFVRWYRSSWRDWLLAIVVGVGYTLIAIGANALTGGNYGYLGRPRPAMPTIVDLLGPWPIRIVWIMLLGTAALVIVKVLGDGIDQVLVHVMGVRGESGPERHAQT
ncbi:MAG: TIGR02206 family membrane protein [Phycisphaerales bacterium]|nr:TIGR02206 family membrane protein [Phycisphaerales bacterium]